MNGLKFNYYAKGDFEDPAKKVCAIDESQVEAMNAKGFDIFWTPQEFAPGRRRIEDIKSVRFICGDYDYVTADELSEKLEFLPTPTTIIKTRGGYHVYWQLSPAIQVSHGSHELIAARYRTFMEQRLIPRGADKQAKDVARLLRVPGCRYWRDSKGNRYDTAPIMCELVYAALNAYSWETLETYMPVIENRSHTQNSSHDQLRELPPARTPNLNRTAGITRNVYEPPKSGGIQRSDDFWAKANAMDCQAGITRLSGTAHCRGEEFSFKRDASGFRILVNGKACNAWIDKNGLIGSTAGAGPTVVNWLEYYGHGKARIAEILKEVFHELKS